MNRTPLIPSFSPTGGEGAQRAVEGDSGRFMASIHARILEAFPFHEPSMLRVADPRSGARLCEAQRFMVSTHVRILEVLAAHGPRNSRRKEARF